jgi:nitrate reductase gamma subunit
MRCSGKFSAKALLQTLKVLQHTVLSKSPITILVSAAFHACLFFTPLFLLSHNILMSQFIGVSLFSFSENTTNIMTIIFLVCALYFLIRRVTVSRIRMITSFYDYLILLIAVLPFLTGLLAFYQFYDYRTIILLHMLSGELMLMVAPFTMLFHMVFFFIGRFVLINQHTIGKGNRIWHS